MNVSAWLQQISQADTSSSQQKKKSHYQTHYERETLKVAQWTKEEKPFAFKDLHAKVNVIGVHDRCVENKEYQTAVKAIEQNKAE